MDAYKRKNRMLNQTLSKFNAIQNGDLNYDSNKQKARLPNILNRSVDINHKQKEKEIENKEKAEWRNKLNYLQNGIQTPKNFDYQDMNINLKNTH